MQKMVSSNIISMGSLSHEEEALLTSLLSHQIHPQTSPGETRARQRRRKARGGGDGGAAGGVVDAKKRRLSDEQVKFLEMRFGEETKLEFGRKVHLAAELGIDAKQVAVWFQNRRARHKSKQVEEAYLKLKSIHDDTVIEKCHLENEVLKLKDKLLQAQEKIKQLSPGTQRATGGSNLIGSPSPSGLSYQLPSVSDFGGVLEEEYELMSIPDYYEFSDYTMEWAYLYGM